MQTPENHRLIESAHHFRRLFEASQDGILVLNFEDGKIEDANPFITDLLGFTRAELIGKELWEIGAILDKAAALASFAVLKKHGYVRYNNLPLQSKAGKLLNVEFISNVYDLDHHSIIQCLIRDIAKQKEAEQALADYKDAVSVSFEEMAGAFSALIEKRDSYTAGHQVRVSRLAVAIGQELKLEPHVIDGIRFASKIHDIGKMAVPTEILTKPDALNTFEMAMLRNHAQAGYDVVKGMRFPWPVAQMILQHHERLDGSGYPNQLRDGDIIYEARVIAVADTVEAMTGRRPYRATPGLEVALEIIKAGSGTIFDAEIVNACIKVFADGFQFDGGLPPKSHEAEHL